MQTKGAPSSNFALEVGRLSMLIGNDENGLTLDKSPSHCRRPIC